MAEAIFPASAGRHETCTFQSLHLRVGERIELQFLPASLHPRLFTTLLGYAPGESILVRTPYVNGLPVNVQEGQTLIVRGFSGTTAFGFHSTVQRNCIAPFLYFHLDFPGDFECLQLRHDLRVPLSLLAEAHAGDAWHPVRLLDLGVGGALMESARPLGGTGVHFDLRFSVPLEPLGDTVLLILRAALLHEERRRDEAGGERIRYGVAFEGVPASEAVCLQNFVYRLRLESGMT